MTINGLNALPPNQANRKRAYENRGANGSIHVKRLKVKHFLNAKPAKSVRENEHRTKKCAQQKGNQGVFHVNIYKVKQGVKRVNRPQKSTPS